MFSTIIWATDGSPSADCALQYAKSLATEHGGALVVFHCVETFPAHHAAGLPVHAGEEETKSKIKRQVAELEEEGLDVSARFVTGAGQRPAHAIADAARELGADVIVTGTRGHTAIGGLVVGSVTHRLLHISPCPVLAVPTIPRAAASEPEAALAAAEAG